MKKVALVFVLAVLAPSLVLAWLAVRSLRDQQFLLERQQSLLDQQVTDALAQNIADYLAQRQRDFGDQVESLAAAGNVQTLAAGFDEQIRQRWPLAEVGFCVTATGKILSPLPNARPAAQMFRLDNAGFLGNREPVEVYLTANNATVGNGNSGASSSLNFGRGQASQTAAAFNNSYANNSTVPSRQDSNVRPPIEIPNRPEPTQSVAASGGEVSQRAIGELKSHPSVVADTPPSQAFALSDSADNVPRRSEPASAGRNAFFIPPGQVAGQNRQSAKPAGRPVTSNLSTASRSVLASATDGGQTELAMTKSLKPSAPAVKTATPPASASNPAEDQPASRERSTETASDVVSYNDSAKDSSNLGQAPPTLNFKTAQSRKVSPQSQAYQNIDRAKADATADDSEYNMSKVIPAEAEFRQLIGDQTDGMFARFLQNKLKLMCWHRLHEKPDLIFGAQLNLDQLVDGLRGLVRPDRPLGGEVCLAVLDENAKPIVLSRDKFQANWKRPFVATEVGEALPHWEVAAYLVDPAQLTQAAHTAKLTLGLLIAVLVVAIGVGGLLVVRGLEAELKLARQKTDFVSNVSHELKTPLTSIRMFSELLADGRVPDHAKQRTYLQIITSEAARLTRLINNVLDFSRMERGEKKYNFQPCDLTDIVRAAADTFRAHLESEGFRFLCEPPAGPILVRGEADALSQIIVNLLSNAEKYSNGGKEIALQLGRRQSPLPHAEIKVLDRGPGVPRGSEEKVFEKFYRAHDSLSSGIQGSGLGLTIARQIARAHGGDVVYEPREGGGSCFMLRLPIHAIAAGRETRGEV
jgi:signal transduction histidine kinase